MLTILEQYIPPYMVLIGALVLGSLSLTKARTNTYATVGKYFAELTGVDKYTSGRRKHYLPAVKINRFPCNCIRK